MDWKIIDIEIWSINEGIIQIFRLITDVSKNQKGPRIRSDHQILAITKTNSRSANQII